MNVGFVGLGDQGAPMAQRILAAGFPLAIWARRAASLAAFEAIGAVVAGSLEELGARSDFVGVCVTDDRDARQVILAEEGGVLAGMKTGSAIAVHATVHPTTCIELAECAAERGVAVVDAPVSGGGQRALVGTLTVMVGGARADFERFRPVFETYGDPVRYLGALGNGQRCKLVNNLLFSANLQIAADIAKLGDALGLERDALFEILKAGSGRSYALDVVPTLDGTILAAGFANLIKDTALMGTLARDAGLEPLLVERAAEALAAAIESALRESGQGRLATD